MIGFAILNGVFSTSSIYITLLSTLLPEAYYFHSVNAPRHLSFSVQILEPPLLKYRPTLVAPRYFPQCD